MENAKNISADPEKPDSEPGHETEWVSHFSRRSARFERLTKEFIRARPLVSTIGAVTVGFAANWLLSRPEAPRKTKLTEVEK